MKIYTFLTYCLPILIVSCSLWQNGNGTSGTSDSFNHDAQLSAERTIKIYPKKRFKGVKGVCLIKANNNFFDNYCNKIKLSLINSFGEVIDTTQTDEIGNFNFKELTRPSFFLVVGDKKYKTLAEEIIVTPGTELTIYLIPSSD